MRPGRVTIVDVARNAGVSKSTVSLVLSGSPLVAEATRERVTRAMRTLGYVYHRGAASLRAASSDFVGMVINDLTNPFFAELAVGIEDALYKLGFTPILANTNENPERQAQVLRSLREHGVAGIIISPARGTDGWTLRPAMAAVDPRRHHHAADDRQPPALRRPRQPQGRARGGRAPAAPRPSPHRLHRRRRAA